MDEQTVRRNREQQALWYGEPVGDTVRRVLVALDLTQGQLASVIGMSAPMLSQLASGQRGKIANPAVLGRLQALTALADDARTAELSRTDIARRVDEIRALDASTVLTSGGLVAGRGADAARAVLRAVASPTELARAAELLDEECPAVAEVLRVSALGDAQSVRVHGADHVSADER